MIEAAKAKIRKYIKREKRKDLPTGMDYWDFSCAFGTDDSNSKTIHISEIDKSINEIEKTESKFFYIEIVAKAAKRKVPNPNLDR